MSLSTADLFLQYAGEFEKSFADDNWERIKPFFHADARYEVICEQMPVSLTGPEEICAGFKKSLDNFDRQFDSREIEASDDMSFDESSFKISWKVLYKKSGAENLTLAGRSEAHYRDGKIERLCDYYTREQEQALVDWLKASGLPLSLSYK